MVLKGDKGSKVVSHGLTSKEKAERVVACCSDILELYNLYENNWYDAEGQVVPIISATLQMVNRDYDLIDIILFLQMDDVTENAIYQQVAEGLSAQEAKAVFEFSKSAIDCDLGVISSD